MWPETLNSWPQAWGGCASRGAFGPEGPKLQPRLREGSNDRVVALPARFLRLPGGLPPPGPPARRLRG
eukprot:10822650-Alexandrium_andersonii.AAC.1